LKDKKVWFTEYNNKDGNINNDPNRPENPWEADGYTELIWL